MDNKILLSSIAMDLKRVALGYHRGSRKMGERFLEEALKRKIELEKLEIEPYLKKLLGKLDEMKNESEEQLAEDALMYSTLFQNAALKISK